MFKAVKEWLGVELSTAPFGEVHEEHMIDAAIKLGMAPVRVTFMPVSVDHEGNEFNAYTEEEAVERFSDYVRRFGQGLYVGKRNGVWHASVDSSEMTGGISHAYFDAKRSRPL